MLKDNLHKVQTQIDEALSRRTETKLTGDKVTLVAVTKNHPVDVVLESLALGVTKDVYKRQMQNHPFENADAPVLAELVAVGKELGVDRVIYMEMEPPRNKETGFMVIVGSQTYSSVITMKLKCVDVKTEKYLFNRIVEEVGSSSAVAFWKIGGASQSRAVKKGVAACMTEFLTAFD